MRFRSSPRFKSISLISCLRFSTVLNVIESTYFCRLAYLMSETGGTVKGVSASRFSWNTPVAMQSSVICVGDQRKKIVFASLNWPISLI